MVGLNKKLIIVLLLVSCANSQALTHNQAKGLTIGAGLLGVWFGKIIASDGAGRDSNKTAVIAGMAIGGAVAGYWGNYFFGSRTPGARINEASKSIANVLNHDLTNPGSLINSCVLARNANIQIGSQTADIYVDHVESSSGYKDYSLLDARNLLEGHLRLTGRADELLRKARRDSLRSGDEYGVISADQWRSSLNTANRLTTNRLGVITKHGRFDAQRSLKIIQDDAQARRDYADAQRMLARAESEKAHAATVSADAAQTQATVAVLNMIRSIFNSDDRRDDRR